MRPDQSIASRMYCQTCKRMTDHFGLVSPESQILFFECVKCGTIHDDLQSNNLAWARNAMMAIALTGVVGLGAYMLLKPRERDEESDELSTEHENVL